MRTKKSALSAGSAGSVQFIVTWRTLRGERARSAVHSA